MTSLYFDYMHIAYAAPHMQWQCIENITINNITMHDAFINKINTKNYK